MSKTVKGLLKLSKPELEIRIDELRAQLAEQKRAQDAGELANRNAIKRTRREIAVALTLISGTEEKAAEAKSEET